MTQQVIKPFIKALGGATKVATEIGIKRDAVYQWSERDFIPYRHRPALMTLAASKGVDLPDVLASWLLPSATAEPAKDAKDAA